MTIDRTQMPRPKGFEELIIPNPKKIVLDNGLIAFLLPGENQEVTRFDMVFDAGTALQKTSLQAAAVNDLLADGTLHHTSFEIAEILDFHGAYTDYFLTKDVAGVTLYGLTKYYDRLLPLMAELITEAVFPEDEVKLFVERRKQEFQVNSQKVQYKASQAFNKLIFGEKSAYGQTLNEKDFDFLHRDLLLEFYEHFYRNQSFFIILSGKIDDAVLQNLNRIFGKLPVERQNNTDFNSKDFVFSGTQQKEWIKKQNALQSAIRMGTLTINRNHPDFPALSLLNTVLGGYFGSRLMRSVREEKGYTYGIYSAIQNHRHAALWGIATEVNAQHTRNALKEIERQILLLREKKIEEEELQTVKNYVYGSYLRNFDGPIQLADRLKKSLELNISFLSYKKILEQMMHLSPDDLCDVAGKYLQPQQLKIVIAGDISQLD